MEITIIEDNYNPLIGRKEVNATITHVGEVTPTRETVRSKIAAQLNTDVDHVVIQKILGHFGEPQSQILVHCYDEAKDVHVFEPNFLLKRNKLIEEKAKEG
jgi:small subunit ribosomal protein S24e